MTEPNLADWAEALVSGIKDSSPKTIEWVEAELRDIADKFYQMGFEYGDKNGWWKEQEANNLIEKDINIYQCEHGKDWRGLYPCIYCEMGVKK